MVYFDSVTVSMLVHVFLTSFINSLTMQTRKSAIADCTARHVWNMKCASFLLGVGALSENFMETESSPAKMLTRFNRQLIALLLCCWKFLDNETL